MKGITGLAAILILFSAHPAVAQQPAGTGARVAKEAEDVLQRSGIAAAIDSVAAASTPELEHALGELTVALNGLVSRIANDPQLRRSAIQAAHGMLGVAQVVVAEQSKVLQDVLRAAAEEIQAPPASQPGAPERR